MKALYRESIEKKMFSFFPSGITLIDLKGLECVEFFCILGKIAKKEKLTYQNRLWSCMWPERNMP